MRTCLLFIALLAWGCDESESEAPSTETPQTEETAERRTIAVIPKGTTHVFWRSVHAGALAKANELGVDILWQGPVREDDRAAQIRVVEDMIARGVDAIALAPLDDTALAPVATEAHREGIPVIIFDSNINWRDRVTFVATDNFEGGVSAARRMNELLEGQGKVVVMRYQEGSASTNRREEGFLETIRTFEGIEVISDNQYGGATTETAFATAENLLTRFEQVDGVFTPNESTTFGMLRALQESNRAGRVKLVGFDANEALVGAMREGHVHGLVVQNPVRMGREAVGAAVAKLNGDTVPPRVDTGAVVVTAESMEEHAALLNPDLSVLE